MTEPLHYSIVIVHYSIVIVGGGTAGLTVAAQLCRRLKRPSIAVVEPSDKHYYQPLWTLVGGGVFSREASERDEASCIPCGATWLRDAVATFHPDDNYVLTHDGRRVGYDFLVVAPGIQLDWSKIKGLEGNVGRYGICSNYSYATVESTWDCIRTFQGGRPFSRCPIRPSSVAARPRRSCTWPTIISAKQGSERGLRLSMPRRVPASFPPRNTRGHWKRLSPQGD